MDQVFMCLPSVHDKKLKINTKWTENKPESTQQTSSEQWNLHTGIFVL
jgi:hypothetical protein